MKSKKAETNMFAIVGILAVVAILGYFFLFRTGGECQTDADCASGQVCNLDGVCQAHDPCDWDKYSGLKPDSRCEDNGISEASFDPDCPAFCPAGTPLARQGAVGFCCYNDDYTQALDCDTGEPFFETEVNEFEETINILPSICGDIGLQAVVSFRQTGTTGTEKFLTNVKNRVSWNAPATYPGDIVSMSVWLSEVKIDGLGNKDTFIDAWRSGAKSIGGGVWSGSPQGSVATSGNTKRVYGTPIKFTSQGTGTTGAWESGGFNIDDLDDGTYTISYKYCFQDDQGKMEEPTCDYMVYDITKSVATISFTVNAELQ